MRKKTDPFERTQRALAAFDTLVDELYQAAADHQATAGGANDEIDRLRTLSVKHTAASADAVRRANKIAELIA